MSGWPTERLSALCRAITVGYVSKMSDQYVTEGVPFLRSQDIEPGRVCTDSLKFIPTAFHEKLSNSRLRPGDVVIVRTGYPGTAAVIPATLPDCNCADLVIARPGPRLDPRFLAFVLNSPWGKGQVRGRLVGVAQQHFNVRVAQALEVPAPPLPTQRRIAAILGAYDDLIEVNRRRIAVLEEMARRLFEEWFVAFRFPGHDTTPLQDTPHGPLPQGWRWARLDEVAAVNAASIKPGSAPETIGYIDIASVSVGRIEEIAWLPFRDAPGRARRKVHDGSVIWSMVRPNRKSYALIVDPEPNLIASTGFAVIDAREVPFSYLHQWVTSEPFVGYLTANATGAAYPAVTGAVFERAIIAVPPAHVLSQFNNLAEPMLRNVDRLARSNTRLAAARDQLLPRLISGELTVADAERTLETAA